jgi:hypothetical protein
MQFSAHLDRGFGSAEKTKKADLRGTASAQQRKAIKFLLRYAEALKARNAAMVEQIGYDASGYAFPPIIPKPKLPSARKVVNAISSVSAALDEGVQHYGDVRGLLRSISRAHIGNVSDSGKIMGKITEVLSY